MSKKISKKKPAKAKRQSSFFGDLQKLRDKYPQVYLEAWTPDDFEFIREDKDDSESPWDSDTMLADWSDPQWIDISNRLYKQFDANVGTSWLTLRFAIETD
jgi:hypothetical protein